MAANRDSYDRRNARGDYPSDGAGSYARRSGGLSQKEKGKIVNVGAWGLLALILLLGVILAIGVLVHNCSGSGIPGPGGTVAKDKVTFGNLSVTAADAQKGALALSNKLNSFATNDSDPSLVDMYDYRSKMHSGAKPYKLSGMTAMMNKEAFAAMDNMLTACAGTTGCDDVTVRLAYVTAAEAKDSNVARSLRTNAEDYKTGMGCDLLIYTDEGQSQKLASNATVMAWLEQNAARYGFVVRYPADKAEKTGVAEYTEYYRYVGVPHATYMKANNLCLEEYLVLLRTYTSKDRLSIQALDGKTYEVYYCSVAGDGSISCPTNYNYTVSGTNEGGVVVTIDRSVVANQPIYTDNAQSATEPATAPESVSASESQTTP